MLRGTLPHVESVTPSEGRLRALLEATTELGSDLALQQGASTGALAR